MSTTNTLIKGGAVLVGVGAIVLVVRMIMKKSKEKKGEKAKFDEAVRENEKAPELQQQADTYSPTADVGYLENLILGINYQNYPDEVAGVVMPKSRARLVKLNNAWKSKVGESLVASLEDEWSGAEDYAGSINKLRGEGIT
jgi:methyl coenzyme M reductase subunit C-like uncharacterized protein (methanogenesis marker protein 7)